MKHNLLKDKVPFDRDALDDAIQEQSGLFLEAAEHHAQAVSERDQAKSDMEQELARASDRARVKLGEKKTEGAVKEMALRDKQYKEAERTFLQAKLNADYAVGLREAFDMRGKMLREMAQLFIAGYYQTSAVSGKTRRGVNEIVNKSNRAMLTRSRMERKHERDDD